MYVLSLAEGNIKTESVYPQDESEDILAVFLLDAVNALMYFVY